MKYIYYKDDFTLLIKVGNVPDWDFDIMLRTQDNGTPYRASRVDGICKSCEACEDAIKVVCDSHRLLPGKIIATINWHQPDNAYSDGVKNLEQRIETGVELTSVPVQASDAEVEAIMPYIKGEPFRYEDFTAEQIEGLQRPAIEASEEAQRVVTAIEGNERQRVSAESEREDAELLRVNAEMARQTDEQNRRENDAQRQSDTAEAIARCDAAISKITADCDAVVAAVTADCNAVANSVTADCDAAVKAADTAAKNAQSVADNYATELASKQGKLTTSEDLTLSNANLLSLTAMAKKRLFIDIWNAACQPPGMKIKAGQYNAQTGYFELNDLTDITYAQAIQIYNAYNGEAVHTIGNLTMGCTRTMIPQNGGGPTYIPSCDYSKYETVRLFQAQGSYVSCFVSGGGIFNRCYYVRKWLDVIKWFDGNGANTNKNTIRLDSFGWVKHGHPFCYFRWMNTNINGDFRYYENIGLDSWEYLVKNRHTGSDANPITITVHPDVYAKLTGDTTQEAAAKLSEEELAQWVALNELAIEKEVNFVTVDL